MITRKEIAWLYGCEYRKVTQLLKAHGIISANEKGKGKRKMITPQEFDLLRSRIGDPIEKFANRTLMAQVQAREQAQARELPHTLK